MDLSVTEDWAVSCSMATEKLRRTKAEEASFSLAIEEVLGTASLSVGL